MKSIKTAALSVLAVITGVAFSASPQAEETLRLEWVMQGQFAGPIVAYDKGYYEEAGRRHRTLAGRARHQAGRHRGTGFRHVRSGPSPTRSLLRARTACRW